MFYVQPDRIPVANGATPDNLYNEFNFFSFWKLNGSIVSRQRFIEFEMPDYPVFLDAHFAIPSQDNIPDDPLDLMIIYTSSAKDYIIHEYGGGVDNFMSFIMAYLNDTLDESLINININLVHNREISYIETFDFNEDISRLFGKNDGYMDEIFLEREIAKADLVSILLRGRGEGVLGKGYALKQEEIFNHLLEGDLYISYNYFTPDYSRDSYFLSATTLSRNQPLDIYDYLLTFVHEIGHNLGAGHHQNNLRYPGPQMYKRYMDINSKKGYSKAYVFYLPSNGNPYATVMNQANTNYTRIGRFSNTDEDAMLGGAYTGELYDDGTCSHNNAKTINFSAYHVSNYVRHDEGCGMMIQGILLKSPEDARVITIDGEIIEHGTLIGPFLPGRELLISAEPHPSIPFAEWNISGNHTIIDPNSTETTLIIGNNYCDDFILTAVFGNKVNLSKLQSSCGEVYGSGYYSQGDEVTITADPENFICWRDLNTDIPSETSLPINLNSFTNTFEMPDRNVHLEAQFGYFNHIVTSINPLNGGIIHISDNYYNNYFEIGNIINVSAIPMEDYCFSYWDSDEIEIVDPSNPIIEFIMPSYVVNLTAYFKPKVTINTEPAEAGNAFSDNCSDYYEIGMTYNIFAEQECGYEFSYWVTSENCQIDNYYNQQTCIIMPEYPLKITAHFSETYNLALDSDPEGIGAVFTGTGNYIEGEPVSISVSDIEGYEFISWTGDDIGLLENSSEQSTSFIMPDRDVVFTALFEEILDKAVISFKQPSEMKGIWIWSYNEGRSGNKSKGSEWMSVLSGTSSIKMQAADITNNGDLEIVASLEGNGLWYYSIINNSWHLIISMNPNEFAISKTPDGYQVIASFADYGIYCILIDESRSTWNRILTIPGQRIVSANIDRDAEDIDELIISFAGYGLYIYDYYEDKFTRILSVWPSLMSADDITGDTFDEIVCCFYGYGIYLGTFNGEGRDIMTFEEKYTCFDIANPAEDKKSGKGLSWVQILSVSPDGPMQTGNIANYAGSEIIISYSQLVYSYSHGLGWSQIPSLIYFEQIISGNFTDSINEDLIIYDTELNNLYLWRSDSGLLELLWENSGDGEITAVSTL